MKRSFDSNLLVSVAGAIAVSVAWAVVGPSLAAGIGLVLALILFANTLAHSNGLERITTALHRVADGDPNASLPLRSRPSTKRLITAAAHLAGALRASRDALTSERLRRRILEEALKEGLVILDAQQHVLVANELAGRMLGLQAEDSRGKLLQQCTRCPELNLLLESAFTTNGRHQADFEPPGSPGLIVEGVVACVADENHCVAGALLLLSDVTAARSLDRMRSDFAANVSHELRTPITNIRGYVETLLQVGLDDPATARKFLDIVHRNASRLGALVEDLLLLSFVESPVSRERIQIAAIPAQRLFDWIKTELGPAAEARGIRLSFCGDPTLCVHANPLLAEQAIGNLVSNAIRYAPDGTLVEFGCTRHGNSVAIAIRDEGPGIPERHVPRLFERFYRVETSRTPELGGTGLGLAIVKHIAMVHGGSIEVQSVVGSGSTFTLRLPVAEQPNAV